MTDDVAALQARIAELEARLGERETGKTFGTLTGYETDGDPGDPYYQRPFWKFEVEPNVAIRLKRMFPRIEPWRGELSLVDTPEVARDLEWVLERYPLEMSDADREHLRRRADQHRRTEREVTNILAGGQGKFAVDHAPTLTLYPEQEQAAHLVHATGRLLLGDEVGMGKTISALATVARHDALPAVIVVPAHLAHQWHAEARRVFPTMKTHLVRTSKVYDPSRRRGTGHYSHQPDVYIVTYTMLHGWVDHLAPIVKTVVFEEAQELRHPDTRKYRVCEQLARKADFRLSLTATPVMNYGGEAHTVIEVIDKDVLGSRREFVTEWGDGDRGTKTKINDPAALGRYLRSEGVYLARKRKKGPPQKIPYLVDTSEKDLDRQLDAVLDLAYAVKRGEGSSAERMRAAGELDWKVRQATGIAKIPQIDAFSKMLLESEDKIVVWLWHRALYDALGDRLAEFNPVMYSGSESPAGKQRAVERFAAPLERTHSFEDETWTTPDPEASRVLLMSLKSGAGVDGLQRVTKTGVFGELDWSPQVHDQCLSADTEILTDRGWRGRGQVEVGDKVAAFDPKTGAVKWRPALRVVDRPLGAEAMYELRTPGLDLRLTAGHRMLHRHRFGRGNVKTTDWHFETAETLSGRGTWWYIPVAGTQRVKGLDLTDDEIELLGLWLADGYLNHLTREFGICQSTGSPLLGRIEELLTSCGFAWSYNDQRAPTNFGSIPRRRYRVPKFRSKTRRGRGWAYLEPYLDKDFAPALERMNARQVALFMRGLHLGDGSKQYSDYGFTTRSYHITSGNSVCVDRLQSLLVRRGWRATISTGVAPSGNPRYTLRTKPEPVRQIGGKGRPKLKRCDADPAERVWCVENDVSTLLVRRNGKVAVVGNCLGRIDPTRGLDPRLDATDVGSAVGYFLHCDHGSDPVVMDVLNIKRMQSEPIHDPDAPLFELPGTGQAADDRMRKLADAVIARRARRKAAA